MQRDLDRLRSTRHDVIIVGGGIHGATIAHQLSACGLQAALLERDDFGGATSANSLKILHSGLRYLQHLNFKRIRESVFSRKYFLRYAPHLIRPMPCLMPTYGLGIESKPVMAMALLLFDLITCDRNQGAPAANRVKRGRILSRQELLSIGPGIRQEGLTGAALWYDDLIVDTERLTLTFIKLAADAGACCVNYCPVEKILIEEGQIRGVQARDASSGDSFTLAAPLVINAAGPWLDELQLRSGQTATGEDLAKAVNIVVNKSLFPGHGVGLSGTGDYVDQDAAFKRAKRLFFFAPWQGKTMIGTTYHYSDRQSANPQVSTGEIDELLQEVNSIYPLAQLSRQDVVFAHAGLVAAHHPRNAASRLQEAPQIVKHSQIIDHQQVNGLAGLYSIASVKYTTAPAIACQLQRMLQNRITVPAGKKQAPAPAKPESKSGVALAAPFQHLPERYGWPTAQTIIDLTANQPSLLELLHEQPPLLRAEVVYAIQEEMALHLTDIILRRCAFGSHGCPPPGALADIAAMMAELLGWDTSKQAQEINQLQNYYHILLRPMANNSPSASLQVPARNTNNLE